MEAVAGIAQVDRDQAVLLLAAEPHHWRWTPGVLSPFLTSLVSSMIADGMRPGVLVADDVLELVAQAVVVPVVLAEELLQGPGCDAGVDGDRLDALLGDVRELPGDVCGQMGAGVLAREAAVEPLEELLELRLELSDLRDVHARASINLGDKHSFAVADRSSWDDLGM